MVRVIFAAAFVTHYHRAGRRPFLNLSDLPEDQVAAVLDHLAAPGEHEVSYRRFGPRYMALREATEARARELFTAAVGRPQREAPHYLVLGTSAWFAGLYTDAAQVRLAVADLPAEATSFTYGDSITVLGRAKPSASRPLTLPTGAGSTAWATSRTWSPATSFHRTPGLAVRTATPVTSTAVWTTTSRSSCGPMNPCAHLAST